MSQRESKGETRVTATSTTTGDDLTDEPGFSGEVFVLAAQR
jgi:hypothetical protein